MFQGAADYVLTQVYHHSGVIVYGERGFFVMKRIISFLDKSMIFEVNILLGVHLMKGLLNNALERA